MQTEQPKLSKYLQAGSPLAASCKRAASRLSERAFTPTTGISIAPRNARTKARGLNLANVEQFKPRKKG